MGTSFVGKGDACDGGRRPRAWIQGLENLIKVLEQLVII